LRLREAQDNETMFQEKLQQPSKRNPVATIHAEKEHNTNIMSRSRTVKRALIDKKTLVHAVAPVFFCALRMIGKCPLPARWRRS
jgi:hypothetical protein